MPTPRVDRPLGILLALLGVLVLTPDTLLMRWVALDPWTLAAYRGWMMGSGMLLIYLFLNRGIRPQDFNAMRSWLGLSVILVFGSNSITFTLAVHETSVTLVLTAIATGPLIAAILSRFILKERLTRSALLAILFSFLGVVMVVSGVHHSRGAPGGSPLLGAFFASLTAFAWAYTLVIARLKSNLNIIPVAAVGGLISGSLCSLLSPNLGVPPDNRLWLLLMGFFVLPVSFSLLTFAPRYAPATAVGLILLLEAVLGPFWVWLGTGEKPGLQMIIGTFIVLITLTFYILGQSQPRPRHS